MQLISKKLRMLTNISIQVNIYLNKTVKISRNDSMCVRIVESVTEEVFNPISGVIITPFTPK